MTRRDISPSNHQRLDQSLRQAQGLLNFPHSPDLRWWCTFRHTHALRCWQRSRHDCHPPAMQSRQPPSSHDPTKASALSAFAGAVLTDLTDEQLSVLAARLRPHLHADHEAVDRLLLPGEAAARLGIHVKTLTRAARQGRVPGARRVGRAWRFDAAQLDLEPIARTSTIAPSPGQTRRRAHGRASSAVDAIRTGRRGIDERRRP